MPTLPRLSRSLLLGGQLEALARVAGNGTVHLIVDVSGYYE